MMFPTIWLARHGHRLDFIHPEWFNTAKRRYDPPLSQQGLLQAQELGIRLENENIGHIFSSPFLRGIQTAYPVAEKLHLSIKLESGFSEWLNPEWMTHHPQTHPPELLKKEYPTIDWNYQSCVMPIYPEDEATAMQRTVKTLRQLISNFSEDILIIGHKISVVAITKALVNGNPIVDPRCCCLVKLVYNGNGWDLKLNCDLSHLSWK